MLRVYEFALVFDRRAALPIPLDEHSTAWSVVSGYKDGEALSAGAHPHQKPFPVVEPLTRQYSKTGDVVLDPFAGSGSIPVAALRLRRQVACLELVPEWASRVTERLGQV